MKDEVRKDEVRRYTEQNLEAIHEVIDGLDRVIRADYVNKRTTRGGRTERFLTNRDYIARIRREFRKELFHIRAVRRAVTCTHTEVRWIANCIGDREYVECHECGAKFDRPKKEEQPDG